jgi:hypothetical protein
MRAIGEDSARLEEATLLDVFLAISGDLYYGA